MKKIWAVCFPLLFCNSANSASFDCSKAGTLSEMTICNDIQLSGLDERLGSIYKRAKEAAPDKEKFRQQSNASFRWREKYCHDRECLLKWYAQREETLENIIGEGFLVNAKNVKYASLGKAMDGAELLLTSPTGQMYPSRIQLYFDQIGLTLVAVFDEGYRVRLPYNFDIGYEKDREKSWEKQGNEYAIAQYDFTGDGLDEIIFAVHVPGDPWEQVQVNVIQFFPPGRSSDLGRSKNWDLIGSVENSGISGDPKVFLKEKTITIPRNFRDFYTGITWANGRLVNYSY